MTRYERNVDQVNADKNKPIAPKGYMYKLKDTLEWELCRAEQSGGM